MEMSGLIAFASSVQGIFSLLAFLLLVTIAYAGLFAQGRRKDVLDAIASKDPNLVSKVNNKYGIDISKFESKDAVEATKTQILHETIQRAMSLFFGVLVLCAVLYVILRLLEPPTVDEKSNTDFLRLALLLQEVQDVESRVSIAKEACGEDFHPLFEYALRHESFGVQPSPDTSARSEVTVEQALATLGMDRACTELTFQGGILSCNELSAFLDVGASAPMAEPNSIVLHYTAVPTSPEMLVGMYQQRRAGYHFLIGRDGSITQFVRVGNRAAHAGRGAEVDGVHVNNNTSIGIAFDNIGLMRPAGDGFIVPGIDRPIVPRDDPIEVSGQFWEPYTSDQLEAGRLLVDILQSTYGPLVVVGHSDIDERKNDPGPLLDL